MLPGSRKQEIEEMLHEMIAILPGVSGVPVCGGRREQPRPQLLPPLRAQRHPVSVRQTFDLLSHATAALVTSGTATLETALFDVPQVVCYRTSGLSYAIGKMVIKVPYISLVNLIVGREVVKELIQGDFNARNLLDELRALLTDAGLPGAHQGGLCRVARQAGPAAGRPQNRPANGSVPARRLSRLNRPPIYHGNNQDSVMGIFGCCYRFCGVLKSGTVAVNPLRMLAISRRAIPGLDAVLADDSTI